MCQEGGEVEEEVGRNGEREQVQVYAWTSLRICTFLRMYLYLCAYARAFDRVLTADPESEKQ